MIRAGWSRPSLSAYIGQVTILALLPRRKNGVKPSIIFASDAYLPFKHFNQSVDRVSVIAVVVQNVGATTNERFTNDQS